MASLRFEARIPFGLSAEGAAPLTRFADLDVMVSPTKYEALARKVLRRFEKDEALKDRLYNTEKGRELLAVFLTE